MRNTRRAMTRGPLNWTIDMIVNYTENGWEIISQRAHGLLAAEICSYWKKKQQPSRWIETLIATAEHDDVYHELENDDLLTEQGGPRNFKMTVFSLDNAKRSMQRAESKSAYIALLTARHIRFVHGKEPAAQAKAFCSMLKKKEKHWLSVAQSTVAEVDRSYALLQFCDAFSLLICQQLVQPEQRMLEISTGPDGLPYEMQGLAADCITVKPWPFDLDAFELRYEIRTLKQLKFNTIEQFRLAFEDALPITRTLKINKV